MGQLVLPGYKHCINCKCVKPISEFHKAGRYKGKQKYKPRCRTCRLAHDAHPKQRNKANARSRRYREANPEIIKKRKRHYYEKNKQRIIEKVRQWRKGNPERVNETARLRYEANPEVWKRAGLKYRDANREKINEWERQKRKANPERYRKITRRYYEANRDKISEQGRQYRKANPEKVKEANRRWEQANPDRVRENGQRRRARLLGSTGTFTEAQFQALCAHYGNICLCCGEPKELTRDHVVPLVNGGSNDISNIQPLCQSCNSSKGTQSTDYRMEAHHG